MKNLLILSIIFIVLISGCTTQVSETNQSDEVQGEETPPPTPSGEGELQGTVLPPFPPEE